MNKPQNSLPKIAPFVERNKKPPHKEGVDTRGLLSIVTMLVSLAALSIAMVGAGKLAFDVLYNNSPGNHLDGIFVKTLVLGFALLFGWGTALASIREFGNLFYPYIINIYAWGCLTAVCALYFKVIQKLYVQEYELVQLFSYILVLLGGLGVLFLLHLLVEGHDLRPFAIPLLVISVVHLFVIVIRYVFTPDAESIKVLGDFIVFTVMILLSALMLLHIGIFVPIRNLIDGFFAREQHEKSIRE